MVRLCSCGVKLVGIFNIEYLKYFNSTLYIASELYNYKCYKYLFALTHGVNYEQNQT